MEELEDLRSSFEREKLAKGQMEKILKAKSKELSISINNLEFLRQALEEEHFVKVRAIEKAEKDVFMANLKLSSLIQNLPTAVILEDEAHKVLHINANFCHLFDILTPPEMLEGLHIQDIFDLISDNISHAEEFKQDTEIFYEHQAESFKEGYFLKNGHVVECYYAPILANQEVAGHLWQFKDITLRRRTEQELMQAKERAEELVKAKEIFLTSISHEMRTPMNGILGMTTLLGKTPLNEEQQNYLKLIRSSGQNLLVIINDLLDSAKMNAGKLQLEQVPFNISETISTAFQSLIYRADEKNIKYLLEPLPFKNPYVIGDPFRLNQVLINLLNNAIKFTDQGEVLLEVKVLDETETNLSLAFIIRDTGIGIAPENIERIFEGFTQVHVSSNPQYGGTGLGLSISKNLVQHMGGQLAVESKLDQGSIFSFTLNFTKAENPKNDTDENIDYKSLGKLRVLLAEDNEVNLFLTQSIMENWGFDVMAVTNGLEAVKAVQQQDFDLILMDIRMPELSGVQATQQIRELADKAKANIPIVALTANAFPEDVILYLANGLNDYLSKPYEEKELFQKIENNLKSGAVKRGSVEKETGTVDNEQKLYDLEHLHKMCRGNQTFFNKMLRIFIDTVPGSLQSLEYAAQQKDWQQVTDLAHKLKTSFDTMRIASLKAPIRKLEKDAQKKENTAELPTLINKIKLTVNLLLIQLQKEIN